LIIDSIPVGANRLEAVYNPANGHTYVAVQGSSAVAVIGGKVLEMIDTITNIPVSIQVTYREHNDYQLKDSSTHLLVDNILSIGLDPSGIAYDEVNRLLYITNRDSNTISVLGVLLMTLLTP
jgi:DNA-binding beta-propeller fold protein YncE